ncbi:hypothetical protein DYB32_000961 [Aphanomyces invadans]|uniref:Cationic amino acid transporter C-terminal domain-containing protein n=1 Tax=Aphanomyces invadans TaxID=157072 RepID=A0A418B8B1_9STRA|nr:hypothetical protein DYB32_000961 [Aphanomyces invadans]
MVSTWLQAFGRTKPLPKDLHLNEHTSSLKRCLTLFDLICYGVGCSVGAGVYSLIGIGANITGPSISISFLISGIACIFTSLTYSEFAARVPVSSSESAKFNMVVTALNVAVLLLVIAVGSTEVDVSNWEPFAPEGAHGIMQGAGVIFFAYLGFDMVACLAEEVPNPQTNVPRGIIGSLLISMSIYIGVSLVITGYVFSSVFTRVFLTQCSMAPAAILGTDVPIVNAFDFHQLTWVPTMTLSAAIRSRHNTRQVTHVVSFGSMFGLTTAAFTCLMGQPRIFYQMAKDVLAISISIRLTSTRRVFTFVNAGLLVLRYDATSTSPSNHSLGHWLSTVSFPIRLVWFVLASFATCLTINLDVPVAAQLSLGATVLATYCWIHNGTLHPYVLRKVPSCESTSDSHFHRCRVCSSTVFVCPWVPAVPCLGIFSNTYMMTSLPLLAWYSHANFINATCANTRGRTGVGIWMCVGILLYGCFGMHHSKLGSTRNVESLPLI